MLRQCALVLFALAASVLTLPARADQAAYVPQDVADKAAALIPGGTEIRYYCEPCGDSEPTSDTVAEVKVQYTGTDNSYEVVVNDKGIDLAYVYVLVDGTWTNLAMHLGQEVSDVSETLPDSDDNEGDASEVSGFNEFYYAGTIGDRKVQANLWRTEGLLQGSYRYLHVGQDLQLSGEVDDAGRFALTESIEDEKTGSFNGAVDRSFSKLSGKWVSGDGARALDFSLTRVAMLINETSTVSSIAGQTTGTLNYPYFSSSAKGFEEINKTIAKMTQTAYREHVDGFLATCCTEAMLPLGEESAANNYEFNMGDFSMELISDQLLSIVFNVYEYGGGAHGNSYSQTLNLKCSADGKVKPLELSAIFTDLPKALPKISAFLLEDLKKQEAAWIIDGEVTEFKAEELDAFTVSGKGIMFYFDPYAVGPYAQGAFRVIVPFKEVASWLNKEVLPKEILPKE